MPKKVIEQTTDKMAKTISVFSRELSTIRAGRASASLLDKITVDYYGAPTPINQMAGISSTRSSLINNSTL